jgi:hypothetical protein
VGGFAEAMAMNIQMTKSVAALRQRKGIGALAAALTITGAVGGWGISTSFVKSAVAVESRFDMKRENGTARAPLEKTKAALVGSYVVTGTDPDGEPYVGSRMLDISLAPSGALELDWDNGKLVGVGQVVDNVLAVAYSIKGRTVISVMTINPDGSLSGKWSRRTDRGSKGTETWKKA